MIYGHGCHLSHLTKILLYIYVHYSQRSSLENLAVLAKRFQLRCLKMMVIYTHMYIAPGQ